jgi:hypothetical protein
MRLKAHECFREVYMGDAGKHSKASEELYYPLVRRQISRRLCRKHARDLTKYVRNYVLGRVKILLQLCAQ